MNDNEYVSHLAMVKGVTSLSETYTTTDKLNELKNSLEDRNKKYDKKFKSTDDKLSKLIKDNKTLINDSRKHNELIRELFDTNNSIQSNAYDNSLNIFLNRSDIKFIHNIIDKLLMANIILVLLLASTSIYILLTLNAPGLYNAFVAVIFGIIGGKLSRLRVKLKENNWAFVKTEDDKEL